MFGFPDYMQTTHKLTTTLNLINHAVLNTGIVLLGASNTKRIVTVYAINSRTLFDPQRWAVRDCPISLRTCKRTVQSLSLPISQEVALPSSGAVLYRVNNPLQPKYIHGLTPNLQLFQTQLTLTTEKQISVRVHYSNNTKNDQEVSLA